MICAREKNSEKNCEFSMGTELGWGDSHIKVTGVLIRKLELHP